MYDDLICAKIFVVDTVHSLHQNVGVIEKYVSTDSNF